MNHRFSASDFDWRSKKGFTSEACKQAFKDILADKEVQEWCRKQGLNFGGVFVMREEYALILI